MANGQYQGSGNAVFRRNGDGGFLSTLRNTLFGRPLTPEDLEKMLEEPIVPAEMPLGPGSIKSVLQLARGAQGVSRPAIDWVTRLMRGGGSSGTQAVQRVRPRMRAREGVALAGDVAQQTIPRLLAPGKEITTYHGTPHTFAPTQSNPLGEFDLGKMGTGEGAQTYGRGMYLTENPEIGDWYRRRYAQGFYDYPEGAIAWRLKHFPNQTRENLLSQPEGLWFGNNPTIDEAEIRQASIQAAERALNWIQGHTGQAAERLTVRESELPEKAASWVDGEIRKGTRPEDILKYLDNHPNDYIWIPPAELVDRRMLKAAIEPWKGLTESGGSLYEVGLQAHPEELLDLNKPLSEQSSQVQGPVEELFTAAERAFKKRHPNWQSSLTQGPENTTPEYLLLQEILETFPERFAGAGPPSSTGPYPSNLFLDPEEALHKAATDLLSSRGVPGAQYTGRSSGARDYTIWDPRRLSIIKKLMAAIGAVGAGDEVRRRSSSNGT